MSDVALSPKRLQVTLTDPGMHDHHFDVDTWEEISQLLQSPRAQVYTLATVSRGAQVVGWAFRRVGETEWVTRQRPLTEPPGDG